MIAAVVLAAGKSTRFGAQKLLAPAGGSCVVRCAVDRAAASGVAETIVVVGADANAVRAALDGSGARIVENAAYADGMSTSLAAGIAALAAHTEAALIALGDQPLVPAEAYAAVLAEFAAHRARIVAPWYNGVRGHPVLFAAPLFGELRAATGDEGARGVIARDPGRVAAVRLDLPAPVDVDDPAALAALHF
jgi:molybdenum cofactor cytidylyltransferase